jgi:hypothetical protein
MVIASGAPASELSSLTISIDTQNSGTPVPKDLCGTNIDTEGSNPPQDFYQPLTYLEPQVVRFPGGLVGNFYHWADTLGPISSRKPQWTCYRDKTGQFNPLTGAAEYLMLIYNLNSKGMINVNVSEGTAEEAAAWVAFCRGRIGDNRTIGKDAHGTDWRTIGYWAKQRYDLTGISEPANVIYWELGNEIVVDSNTLLNFERKMRAVDPSILIGLVTWCDSTLKTKKSEGKEFQTKVGSREVEAALKGDLGKEVDFLIHHNYTGWPRYTDQIMVWSQNTVSAIFNCSEDGEYEIELEAQGVGISPKVIKLNKIPQISIGVDDKLLQTVTLSKDDKTFKVKTNLSKGQHTFNISFLNDFSGNGEDTNVKLKKTFSVSNLNGKNEFEFPEKISDLNEDIADVRQELRSLDNYCKTNCPNLFIAITEYNRTLGSCVELEGALYMAEFFRICTEFPRIKTAEIWNTISWNFGMRCSGRGEVRVRPTFYVFQMIKELCDRKLSVKLTPNDSDIKVLATRNSLTNEMAILTINFGKRNKKVQFSVSPGTSLVLQGRKYINGDSMFSSNEGKSKITLKSENLQGKSEVLVPGYSVTLFSAKSVIKN